MAVLVLEYHLLQRQSHVHQSVHPFAVRPNLYCARDAHPASHSHGCVRSLGHIYDHHLYLHLCPSTRLLEDS
jgi:hypothetical protein